MGKGRRLLAVMAVPAALASPAAAAPLAQWPLDEGGGQVTADRSGNGHEGRLGALALPDGNDPAWVVGRLGNALRFDGERAQYVAVANASSLNPQHVSVEAWLRRLGTPGQYRYVLSSGATGCNSAPYGLYTSSNGGLAFYVSDSARYVLSAQAAPSSVWDGSWHYAAGTFDGQHLRLYLDGQQVGSGTAAQIAIAYGPAASGVYIGTYRGSCELPFTGDVDELAIHGQALTGGEIAATAAKIAAQPLPGQPPPVSGAPGIGTRGCLKIQVTPKRVAARRRAVLRVTVRRSNQPAAGVRVSVRGPPNLDKRVRTGRKGRARLMVYPNRRGRLRVKAVGAPRRCGARTVTVTKSP